MIIHTPDYIENQIILRQLKFERCMDAWDIDGANIACAQKSWWQGQLAKSPKKVKTGVLDVKTPKSTLQVDL